MPTTATEQPIQSPKKSSKKGLFLIIFVILIVMGGVIAGLLLTQQNQDIREEAFIADTGTNPYREVICNANDPTKKFTVKLYALSESPNCGGKVTTQPLCPGNKYPVTTYSTDFQIVVNPMESNIGSFDIAYVKNSNFCDEACGDPADNNVCNQNPIQENESVSLNIGNNFKSPIITVSRDSKKTSPCGTFQTDIILKPTSICPEFMAMDNTPKEYPLAWGLCKTGTACTPTESICRDVRMYTVTGQITNATSWTRLSSTDLAKLKVGDEVYLSVLVEGEGVNAGFDKAEFFVNGTTVGTSTTVKAKAASASLQQHEFYIRYVIPANQTTFNMTSKVHHTTRGWF